MARIQIPIRYSYPKLPQPRLGNRPLVLVVYDKPGWAFHRIALQIKTHLVGYDVWLASTEDAKKLWPNSDALILLWWNAAESYLDDVGDRAIFPCIYDHELWHGAHRHRMERVASKAASVFASSAILASHLQREVGVQCQLFTDGVDSTIFKERTRCTTSESFTVGWAGSSKIWGRVKGLDLIREAVMRVKGASLSVADSQSSHVPHEKMPDWFSNLDVYCCASVSEGTPNPVLEAASVGLPIISTNVGIVPALLERSGGGLIVDRTVEALATAIGALEATPGLCNAWGQANRAEIVQSWDWPSKVAVLQKTLDSRYKNDN